MLFQELNKIKRSSIIMSIALMALGLVMAMCPEKYINSLIFSCVLFLGSCILATADIAPKRATASPPRLDRNHLLRSPRDLHRPEND